MNKSELVGWLQAEFQQWQAFFAQIDPKLMTQPGVAGDWTIKDMIAHLNGWHPKLIANLRAAQNGEPEPPPAWPAHLQTDDEVNAWIYETNRARSLAELLEESEQLFAQLLSAVQELPEDARIEQVQHEGRDYYLVWLGDTRFLVGEFFDHFHDDHEPDIRRWLAQVEKRP